MIQNKHSLIWSRRFVFVSACVIFIAQVFAPMRLCAVVCGRG